MLAKLTKAYHDFRASRYCPLPYVAKARSWLGDLWYDVGNELREVAHSLVIIFIFMLGLVAAATVVVVLILGASDIIVI